ncbi:hypothetical protein ONS95_013696 [Cadophora gregata]|uniref:uncharacterized protein n=1 Tax=Cadophora gregata TaxID=51156 RepID=UPI0026DC2BAD|nr:uncharacterized protein ONS95_013696 [Cadophora gregata]KAK0113438.1 hypothetical protein ONS96_014304 [Cadophora gregata f. sp. sojae]KAK0114196.1 hypothetical protein ONS95_013696 [Cadophora gregata]
MEDSLVPAVPFMGSAAHQRAIVARLVRIAELAVKRPMVAAPDVRTEPLPKRVLSREGKHGVVLVTLSDTLSKSKIQILVSALLLLA